MEQSILQSTKKILGLPQADESFDLDVITHINSAFSTLLDLGVGPSEGFAIEDADPTWDDFFGANPHLSRVKTYIYLKTRMLFDPPATQYLIGAYEKQIEELEWRLNEQREQTEWVDPNPVNPNLPVDDYGDPVVVDGGGA